MDTPEIRVRMMLKVLGFCITETATDKDVAVLVTKALRSRDLATQALIDSILTADTRDAAKKEENRQMLQDMRRNGLLPRISFKEKERRECLKRFDTSTALAH